jgi:hypothetical protein
MCEKNEEIQKLWKPKIGDWYYESIDKEVECVSLMGESIIEHHSRYHIWIPTQEQLQEILHNYYQNNNSNVKGLEWGQSINEYMFNKLFEFEKDNREIVYDLNYLWLAFVMKEKYNKIWNGEEWIK